VALFLVLVGCSSGGSDSAASTTDPPVGRAAAAAALEQDRLVIDVRTVEEFDAGHIDGAVRVGLADKDFDEQVAGLDANATYVVYCRSGNRSAQATEIMLDAGLDVLDGGAMADMVAAGWPSTGTTP